MGPGKRKARIPLVDAGGDVSPYPFVLIYPQDRHERLLVEQLQALGVEVERQTELLSFEDRGDHVAARLKHADGREETLTAAYLAGCDGAHSLVRHQVGSGFEGGTYKQLFYVADVSASGFEPADEAHVAFDKSEFVLAFFYGETDQYRLIGTVRDERAEHPEALTFEDVGHDAINGLNIRISHVNWFSTYRVHHRVTDQFRWGRAFLLGDAAHVHSPAGGQGMNTGILDAINLAWKLASVAKGQAPTRYSTATRPNARRLRKNWWKRRTGCSPLQPPKAILPTSCARASHRFASVAYKSENVREYLFRIVSQTTLNYHQSPLSAGKAGDVLGGDRLPWVPVPGADNYEPLASIGWQVHVYGEARAELQDWSRQHQIPCTRSPGRMSITKPGCVGTPRICCVPIPTSPWRIPKRLRQR